MLKSLLYNIDCTIGNIAPIPINSTNIEASIKKKIIQNFLKRYFDKIFLTLKIRFILLKKILCFENLSAILKN